MKERCFRALCGVAPAALALCTRDSLRASGATKTIAVLTDAERFPFDAEDQLALERASVSLRSVPGHDPDQIIEAASSADAIFIYHARFPREVIEQLERVRLLARCGVGFDNIDVAAARERGMEVTYVPDYGVEDVADHALALLLTCGRRVMAGDRAIRDGRWPTYAELGPVRRLSGCTLGILGYGRIGQRLAEKARAIGLRVLAFDPYVDEADDPLECVLGNSDFVSVHLPLNPETFHMIAAPELAMMKPGAILVNTARAGVVDTDALVAALRSGSLAFAGIDVFDETPLPASHALRELSNVVLTPHAASLTEESLSEIRKRSIDDVLRVLRGERPRNPVP